MRLVHEEAALEGGGQLPELGDRCHNAIHGEDGVREHQGPAGMASVLLEERLEVGEVAVAIDMNVRAREATAVDETRVVEGIAEYGVAGADEGLDRAEVGRVARREQRSGWEAGVGGEGSLGLAVGRHRSCDEAGGCGA